MGVGGREIMTSLSHVPLYWDPDTKLLAAYLTIPTLMETRIQRRAALGPSESRHRAGEEARAWEHNLTPLVSFRVAVENCGSYPPRRSCNLPLPPSR